jgi:hypothetical protein
MHRGRAHFALLVWVPFVLTGCEHAVWGNVTALGLTVCLFFGTLQLGKRPASSPTGDATANPPSSSQNVSS